MILKDLIPGNAFLILGDYDNCYLRVNGGYVNLITEEFANNEMGMSVARVDRWVIYKAMIKYEIGQLEVEQIIDRLMAEHPAAPAAVEVQETGEDIVAKVEYYFECAQCHKSRRKSQFLKNAQTKICRKCRNIKVDPNQTRLFEEEA